MKTKSEIREQMKAKRDALNVDQKVLLDNKIFDKLCSSAVWKRANTILIYVSHNNEANTKQAIKTYLKNKQFVVPKTNPRSNTLTLHKINSFDDLEEKNYGILEPKKTTEKIQPDEIDLAIIPGIAFDLKGHRIGFGKGYYDRLNKKLNCDKVGLAYEFQIVKNIPAKAHDVPLDMIMTDNKTYNI